MAAAAGQARRHFVLQCSARIRFFSVREPHNVGSVFGALVLRDDDFSRGFPQKSRVIVGFSGLHGTGAEHDNPVPAM